MNQHVALIPPQGVDVPQAQIDAINCLIAIIAEPHTGNASDDFLLRRNKCDAARVLLRLKTRMLKEIAWKP